MLKPREHQAIIELDSATYAREEATRVGSYRAPLVHRVDNLEAALATANPAAATQTEASIAAVRSQV